MKNQKREDGEKKKNPLTAAPAQSVREKKESLKLQTKALYTTSKTTNKSATTLKKKKLKKKSYRG